MRNTQCAGVRHVFSQLPVALEAYSPRKLSKAKDSRPRTAQEIKPNVRPNSCDKTPMRTGPTMSPNSLNEPAIPIVAPRLPSLASEDTAASLFVQTVPIPSPATMEMNASGTPLVKGISPMVSADTATPQRTVVLPLYLSASQPAKGWTRR